MRFAPKVPPRAFTVGNEVKFKLHDCGIMHLAPDEQVTFTTDAGAEYDVARKDWGFYATPSLNVRLEQFGLRGVLIRNTVTGRYFMLLVERGREARFNTYLIQENCVVVCWLDSTTACDAVRQAMSK
jgi:hypothetical protein